MLLIKITWSSSNTNVASVVNGVVNGVSEGTATITARTNNGKVATCTINVSKNEDPIVYVTGVTVVPQNRTMYIGATYKMEYTIKPDNATNKGIIWSSSSPKVARIDSNGIVTALSEGKTIITGQSADGKKKGYSVITVIAKPSSSSKSSSKSSSTTVKPSSSQTKTPTININENNISILKGQTHKLTAVISGSSANIIWSSSDENVVTVKDGNVTALSEGKATITAKISGTTISDKCEVEVIKEENSGIEFADKEIVVYLHQKKNVELIVHPTDMEIKTKEYRIENKEIISVTDDTITGLKLGTTRLKVKVNDKYDAEILVKVEQEPMTLVISEYNIDFNENVYSYELEIDKEKELVIKSNKEITIEGNSNLKNKSVIKITNTETGKIYEITIKKHNGPNYYFIGLIIILSVICASVFIKKKKN